MGLEVGLGLEQRPVHLGPVVGDSGERAGFGVFDHRPQAVQPARARGGEVGGPAGWALAAAVGPGQGGQGLGAGLPCLGLLPLPGVVGHRYRLCAVWASRSP